MPTSRLLVLALLTAAGGVAEAGEGRKRLQPSADHPGKCYDPDLQLVLAPWESVPAKEDCLTYRCEKFDSDFVLVLVGCVKVGVPSGCTLVSDLTLPHPQCCPEAKCYYTNNGISQCSHSEHCS